MNEKTGITESTLWSEFKEGKKEALSAIFLRFYKDLFLYGMKLLKDEDLIKDLIQSLFAKLWESRSNLKDLNQIKSYLIYALRHQLINELKKRENYSVFKKKVIADELNLEFSHEDFLISEQAYQDKYCRVVELLNQLPKKQKEALYLRFFEELPYEEVAEIMSQNVQSVRNLIHKGLVVLRENLSLTEMIFFYLITR